MGDSERQDPANQAEDQANEARSRNEQEDAARTRVVEEGQASTADEAPPDDVIIIK